MTKYELKVSMEEFNRLVDERNFQEAADVADTIEWSKVKDSQLLCRVSDIYKMLGEYEKSRNVLEQAYRQSSRNMNIVYSLCELDLFLFGQNGSQDCYLEAMQLYSMYSAMEPNSVKALILKYKVYQVSQSTWQEQAEVLQEILQRGYNAKYNFELAKVYAQAGQSAAAMNECQKVMAANDGRYSVKAAQLAGQLDPNSPYAQMFAQQAQNQYDQQAGYGQAQQGQYDQQTGYGQAQQGQYDQQTGYGQAQQGQYDQQAGYGQAQQNPYAQGNPQYNYDAQGQQPGPQYDYGSTGQQAGYGQAPQGQYDQQAGYGQAPQGQYDQQTGYSQAQQNPYAQGNPQYNYDAQGQQPGPQYNYDTQGQQPGPQYNYDAQAQQAAPQYDYNNPQGRQNRYSATHSSAENAAQAARRAASAFTTQIQANAVRKAAQGDEQQNIPISTPDQTATTDSLQQNVRQGMKDIYARPYDNYMIQETNGQYAMVLDQGQNTEENAQVDGQMSFQQYLDTGDWDSIRRSIRKNNDEIRANHVLQTTGEILKVFDEGAKHSLVEDIENNVDRRARDYRLSGGAYDGQLDDGLTDGEKSRAAHVAGDAAREEGGHAPSLVEDGDEGTTRRWNSTRVRRAMRQQDQENAQNDYAAENGQGSADDQYYGDDQYTESDNTPYTENDQPSADSTPYAESDQPSANGDVNTDHSGNGEEDHADSRQSGQEEGQYTSVPEEADQIFTEVESEDDLESPELEADDQPSAASDLETPDYNAEHGTSAEAAASASGENKSAADITSAGKSDTKETSAESEAADQKTSDTQKNGENKSDADSAAVNAADAAAEAARKVRDDSVQMAAADAIAKAAEAARAARAAAQSGTQSADTESASQPEKTSTDTELEKSSETEQSAQASADTKPEQSESAQASADTKPEQSESAQASADTQHEETIGELMDEAREERRAEENAGVNSTADEQQYAPQNDQYDQSNPQEQQYAPQNGQYDQRGPQNQQYTSQDSQYAPQDQQYAPQGQPYYQNQDQYGQYQQAAPVYQQPQHQIGIRQLTEEEKKLFGSFAKVESNRVQIVKALDTVSLASYTGNVIVTGTNEDAPDRIVKGLLTMIRDSDHNFTGRAARVSAEVLNKRFAEHRMGFMSQLENGAMVVEHAGSLNGNTVRYLYSQLEQREHGLIVFLVDTKRAMDHLLAQYGSMLGSFNARIDIQYLDDRSLVKYGIAYADSQDYSIDELGVMALSSRISSRQSATHQVTMQEVRDIVDEAIRSASKKTPRHLADMMSRRRYDKDDRIVLRERDFGMTDRR